MYDWLQNSFFTKRCTAIELHIYQGKNCERKNLTQEVTNWDVSAAPAHKHNVESFLLASIPFWQPINFVGLVLLASIGQQFYVSTNAAIKAWKRSLKIFKTLFVRTCCSSRSYPFLWIFSLCHFLCSLIVLSLVYIAELVSTKIATWLR